MIGTDLIPGGPACDAEPLQQLLMLHPQYVLAGKIDLGIHLLIPIFANSYHPPLPLYIGETSWKVP